MKRVDRKSESENSIVKIGNSLIGNGELTVVAGPCAVESEMQLYQTACHIKKLGVQILRGGAFKPRTSPYSFKGLGLEGLKILQSVGKETGLSVITEVMNVRDVERVVRYADALQIGSRNMHNFSLLTEVGKSKKPVVLKRGLCATIEEWLCAAEYILLEGNSNVILCERGIRTFETYTRNTMDISAIPAVKNLSHLPIIVDPSHAGGRRELVAPLAKAALAAGADGIMVEVHPNPEEALSDGAQSLDFMEFSRLMEQMSAANVMLKHIG